LHIFIHQIDGCYCTLRENRRQKETGDIQAWRCCFDTSQYPQKDNDKDSASHDNASHTHTHTHTHTHAQSYIHETSVSNLQGAGEKGQQETDEARREEEAAAQGAKEHPLSFLFA